MTFTFVRVVVVLLLIVHNSQSKSLSEQKSKLKFAAVIFRHGDRNAFESYPNDPNIDHPWPGGFGALTTKGAKHAHNLGSYLRTRYHGNDGFYSPDNIRVMSTSAERCLLTAQNVLAGLLTPSEYESLLPIQWQPATLITMPARKGFMQILHKPTCPRYADLYYQQMDHPDPHSDIYQFNRRSQKVFAYLSKHSGENITNVRQATQLMDVLFVQNDNGLPLPKWTDEIFPNLFYVMKARNFNFNVETPYMARVKGGLLITDTFEQMVLKRNDKLSHNLAIYSGHDSTLFNLMKPLNVLNQTTFVPEYLAMLAFELHCETSDDCNVQIYFNRNTSEFKPEQLSIPNCPAPCSLRQYKRAIRNLIIEDFDEDCKL